MTCENIWLVHPFDSANDLDDAQRPLRSRQNGKMVFNGTVSGQNVVRGLNARERQSGLQIEAKPNMTQGTT